MAELKPCPFCGGTKLKVDRKSRLAGLNGLDMRVEMHTYSVRCNTCHARGGAVGGRVMNERFTRCTQLPDWATTDKALEAKATEAWNRRADGVHGRWEMRPTGMATDTGPEYKAYCTVCNKPNKQYQPPFCPHCGAMMDGGDSDEAD